MNCGQQNLPILPSNNMEVKEQDCFKTAWKEFAGELATLLATEIRDITRSHHNANGKTHNLAQTTANIDIDEDLHAENPVLAVEADHPCTIPADQNSYETESRSCIGPEEVRTCDEDLQRASMTKKFKSLETSKRKTQIPNTHLNLPGNFNLKHSWTKLQYNSRNLAFLLYHHAVWDPGTVKMLLN